MRIAYKIKNSELKPVINSHADSLENSTPEVCINVLKHWIESGC